ncbi:hypothetical protein DEJ30_02740 [Curtobacterium sp. MCPF17_003]|nr:hypothetical protein DEJ30_02740 [Curtobacterium sp. MCPF17_003]
MRPMRTTPAEAQTPHGWSNQKNSVPAANPISMITTAVQAAGEWPSPSSAGSVLLTVLLVLLRRRRSSDALSILPCRHSAPPRPRRRRWSGPRPRSGRPSRRPRRAGRVLLRVPPRRPRR